jgi:hypothetical protein
MAYPYLELVAVGHCKPSNRNMVVHACSGRIATSTPNDLHA